MKKTISLLKVLPLIVVFFFLSCSGDDNNSTNNNNTIHPSLVVGTWKLISVNEVAIPACASNRMTVESDGTGYQDINYCGNVEIVMFDWENLGNNEFHISNISTGNQDFTATIILSDNNNTMVMFDPTIPSTSVFEREVE